MTEEDKIFEEFWNQPDCKHLFLQCECGKMFLRNNHSVIEYPRNFIGMPSRVLHSEDCDKCRKIAERDKEDSL